MTPQDEHLGLERGQREYREAHQLLAPRRQDGVDQEHRWAQRLKRCRMTTLSARSAIVAKVPQIKTSSPHATSW